MEYGQCPGRFQARSRTCSPTFEAWTIPRFTFPNKLWVSFRPSLNTVLYLKFVFTVPLFHTWITALSRSLWTYWLLRQLFHFPLRKKLKSLIRVWLFAPPWTVAHQAPSMEFSRQEYWSRLPFPPPRDLPGPGIEPGSPALQADPLLSETAG